MYVMRGTINKSLKSDNRINCRNHLAYGTRNFNELFPCQNEKIAKKNRRFPNLQEESSLQITVQHITILFSRVPLENNTVEKNPYKQTT